MSATNPAGQLAINRTTIGQDIANLPVVPSMIVVYIYISGGTATVLVEVGDSAAQSPIGVATITSSSIVILGIPSTQVATNVTAISGATVNTTYRAYSGTDPTGTPVAVFAEGKQQPTIIALTEGQNGRKLYQGQPTGSAATLYTVPTGFRTEITRMTIVNVSGVSTDTFQLYHGSAAAATEILPPTAIKAGGWGEFDGSLLLDEGDILVGNCSNAGLMTLTVYGYENLK